jgi:hypothetical protein
MRKKVLGGKLVLLVKRVEVCGRRGLGIEYVELSCGFERIKVGKVDWLRCLFGRRTTPCGRLGVNQCGTDYASPSGVKV